MERKLDNFAGAGEYQNFLLYQFRRIRDMRQLKPRVNSTVERGLHPVG